MSEGRISGTITSIIARSGDAPAARAASSSVAGIFAIAAAKNM